MRPSFGRPMRTPISLQSMLLMPRQCRGVRAVYTGQDIKAISDPFLVIVKQKLDEWALAVDRVRFVGEAVAIVLASDRYLAEDALDQIVVDYKILTPVIDATVNSPESTSSSATSAASTNSIS